MPRRASWGRLAAAAVAVLTTAAVASAAPQTRIPVRLTVAVSSTVDLAPGTRVTFTKTVKAVGGVALPARSRLSLRFPSTVNEAEIVRAAVSPRR